MIGLRSILLSLVVFAIVPIATIGSGCGSREIVDPVLPHDTFTIDSQRVGEVRRINVYLPRTYSDAGRRLPVLYMPDGGIEEDFPHITNTIDALIEEGSIDPVIVVGIENTQRRRDLTGPTTVESDREVAPDVGGSGRFRAFLADELIPEVERRYRCTQARAIVGESLAGYFVIETFFARPDLFERSIAMSPSLWWNDHELVRSASGRLQETAGAARTLWFTAADETDIYAFTDELARALREHAPPGLTWVYAPMREQHHDTIFRAAKSTAFRAALWKAR